MGVLSKIFQGESKDDSYFSPEEALAAIAVAAVAADGYLRDEERQRLLTQLSAVPILEKHSEKSIIKILEKLFHILGNNNLDFLLGKARESLPEELQETAFSVAIDLILVDGIFSPKEKEFLKILWKVFNISVEKAAKLLDQKLLEHQVQL